MATDYSRYTTREERHVTNALLDSIFSDPSRCVTVSNGCEESHGPFFNKAQVNAQLASTGSDWINVYGADARCIGSIWLVWGNGADLISDWTDNEVINGICDPILDAITY